MRRNRLIQSNTLQVFFEVRLKITHADMCSRVASGRKEVITFKIAVLILNPAPQNVFSLGREIDSPVFSTFGDLRLQCNVPLGEVYIPHRKTGAFAQAHSTVQH